MSKTLALNVETVGLTVGQVRKAGSIDVPTAMQTIGEAGRVLGRAGQTVMWDAALLTHYCHAHGVIGKDDGALYPSQNAYAEAFGMTKSAASKSKALGRAAVIHGIRRESKAWTWLTTESNVSKVRDALNGDDPEAFRAALDEAMADKPKAVESGTDTREPRPATESGDAGTDGNGGTDGPTLGVVRTLGDIRAALRHVTEALPNLSDADRDKAHAAILAVVNKDRKARDKAANTVAGEVVA